MHIVVVFGKINHYLTEIDLDLSNINFKLDAVEMCVQNNLIQDFILKFVLLREN